MSLLTVSCLPDYSISLPNSYSLERANDDELYIIDGNRRSIVAGKVTKLGVQNDLVFGYVEEQSWVNKDDVLSSDVIVGYFYISTIDNKIEKGISIDELKKLINNPVMFKPTCADFLGRCK